jgi:hypothetical protein
MLCDDKYFSVLCFTNLLCGLQKLFLYNDDEDASEDGGQDGELLILWFEKGYI